MKLSKNFSLKEMLVTSTGVANVPTDKDIDNMKLLAEKILQPLREYMNRPVIVTSGYRSYEVNKAVKGSKTSQHMRGEAVDYCVANDSPGSLQDEIVRLLAK